tara:strand:+ start:137 stop:739 length:603 start_codon:yes stop_codon:yes gene_type:complete
MPIFPYAIPWGGGSNDRMNDPKFKEDLRREEEQFDRMKERERFREMQEYGPGRIQNMPYIPGTPQEYKNMPFNPNSPRPEIQQMPYKGPPPSWITKEEAALPNRRPYSQEDLFKVIRESEGSPDRSSEKRPFTNRELFEQIRQGELNKRRNETEQEMQSMMNQMRPNTWNRQANPNQARQYEDLMRRLQQKNSWESLKGY